MSVIETSGVECFLSQEPHCPPRGGLWTADLQMVNITLRVLSKPDVGDLAKIFRVSAALPAADFDLDGFWEGRLGACHPHAQSILTTYLAM